MAFDRTALSAKSLYVTKDGKTVPVAVSSLTDAQILAALGRSDNAGALAAGWSRNPQSGAVVHQAVAAPKPELVTTQPAPLPPRSTSTTVAQPLPGAKDPVTGYLTVHQQTKDGWKLVSMLKSKMTPAQIAAAMKNGYNGVVPGKTSGAGADPAAAAPAEAAPTDQPATSWAPVTRVNMSGLVPNVETGAVDWSQMLAAADTIAAVDPTYAGELSQNIMAAQQAIAPIQGQLQGLNNIVIDPLTGLSTGKKRYEIDNEAENNVWGQNVSSVMGNAAARGIGSSGMTNSNIGKANVTHGTNLANIDSTVGKTAMTNLYQQLLQNLSQQDGNTGTSYFNAVNRQQGTIPSVVAAGGYGSS